MKSLSEAAARQYNDLGYYAPVPVLTRAQANALRCRLEAFEATGAGMQGAEGLCGLSGGNHRSLLMRLA